MLCLGILLAYQSILPPPEAQKALAEIDTYVSRNLDRHKLGGSPVPVRVPGFAVAVVHDQDVWLCKGYGWADREAGRTVKPNTVFRLGSVSKVFTATLLMQLRDQGKLCLDDPLVKYLKEFSIRYPGTRSLTIRQIACHGAGLPRQAPLPSWSTLSFPTEAELLHSLGRAQPVLPPFTSTHYSNLGYDCLGLAVERIARRPWKTLVRERIALPLAMTSTYSDPKEVPEEQMAKGYIPNFRSVDLALRPVPPIDLRDAMAPAGAVCSTAEDMAKFLSFEFRDRHSSPNVVLAGDTLREMRQPIAVFDDWSGGIGIAWFLSAFAGETKVEHGGAIFGYVCNIAFLPKRKIGVVLLSNGWIDASAMTDRILSALATVVPIPHEAPSALDAKAIAPLLGHYQESDQGDYRVRLKDGRLLLEMVVLGMPFTTSYLEPVGIGRFRCVGGPFDLEAAEFNLGADGRVTELVIGNGSRVLTRLPQ